MCSRFWMTIFRFNPRPAGRTDIAPLSDAAFHSRSAGQRNNPLAGEIEEPWAVPQSFGTEPKIRRGDLRNYYYCNLAERIRQPILRQGEFMRGKLSRWHEIQGDEMKRCCEKSENVNFRGACPECGAAVYGTTRRVYCDDYCHAQAAWKRQAVRRKERKAEAYVA